MPTSKKAVKPQVAVGGGWLETVKTLVYALLIALAVRTVAFEPFNIPSGSMIPTLLVGDFLFVSKYTYGYSRYSIPFTPPLFGWTKTGRILGSFPKRGDVVVFRNTRDTTQDWVKRVIGLPGDHIQVKQGLLYINGVQCPRESEGDVEVPDEQGTRALAKEYIETLPNGVKHPIVKLSDEERFDVNSEVDANNTTDYVVPDGDLFMMGDNRDNSMDSRFQNALGFVPLENVVGQAQFIFFSVDKYEAEWWQVWRWPLAIRWGRLLHGIH
jgi:signal peptidase I